MNGNNGYKGWGLSLQKQLIVTNGRDKGWGLSLQKQFIFANGRDKGGVSLNASQNAFIHVRFLSNGPRF